MKRPNCSQLDKEIQALIAKYCQGNGIDVGCGYSKIGACVGIDKIPWGCQINKEDKTKKISQADWAFDACELPILSKTMDFVYASHVLEHITLNQLTDQTIKAIDEWLRVLKNGGYLIMITPDINHCIPPVARRAGLKTHHGLDPKILKSVLNRFPADVIKFNTLSSIDVFDCILRKW